MPDSRTIDVDELWSVSKGPGTGKQRTAIIVSTDPSEKDGSDKVWKGHQDLLRQRAAVAATNRILRGHR